MNLWWPGPNIRRGSREAGGEDDGEAASGLADVTGNPPPEVTARATPAPEPTAATATPARISGWRRRFPLRGAAEPGGRNESDIGTQLPPSCGRETDSAPARMMDPQPEEKLSPMAQFRYSATRARPVRDPARGRSATRRAAGPRPGARPALAGFARFARSDDLVPASAVASRIRVVWAAVGGRPRRQLPRCLPRQLAGCPASQVARHGGEPAAIHARLAVVRCLASLPRCFRLRRWQRIMPGRRAAPLLPGRSLHDVPPGAAMSSRPLGRLAGGGLAYIGEGVRLKAIARQRRGPGPERLPGHAASPGRLLAWCPGRIGRP